MKFKKYKTITTEELNIATKVIKSGILSGFKGSVGPDSNGGIYVNRLEKSFEKYFNVKHAISVNSWSSGLEIALTSLQLEPGSEVIVSPWTMSANVMAVIKNNLIPVFCDIEKDFYNINAKQLTSLISNKTKAILTSDIFGQSCDIKCINKIAKKYNLKVISDSAQSIGSKYQGKYTGTLTDIGGFSFNCHKHIQSGEGGILLTNNSKISSKLKLLRNHAENFTNKMKIKELNNMVGSNYRLGEIESALLITQLKKLKKILKRRNIIANSFRNELSDLNGIKMPTIFNESTHSYYVFGMQLDLKKPKPKRDKIFLKLRELNFDFMMEGYANVHLLPLFKEKIAYGLKNKLPWSLNKKHYRYLKGSCPNAEYLHNKSFIGVEMCKYEFNNNELDYIFQKIKSIWKNLHI